jgi:peptide/nickel transport system ATP-binding protein
VDNNKTILSVKDLRVSFHVGSELFHAVNKVNFELKAGKTLAVVGESGSGKSMTAMALMGLLPKDAKIQGNIGFYSADDYHELTATSDSKWQQLRGRAMGMVFQEPMSSLNPVMKIGRQLSEAISTHQNISRQEAKAQAIDWLTKVQLPNPGKIYDRYPHQLSGGQKQRVMIAIAMCNNPVLLLADEPTTALDVTVQREVLQLMHQLQKEHGTAMIFITHDLALAAEMADDVLVMYKGEVMEQGAANDVLHHPIHPYTKALVACRPAAQEKGKRLPVISDFLDSEERIVNSEQRTENSEERIVNSEVLLEVNNLRVWFTEHSNWMGKPTAYFKAVDDVSFTLHKGEVLGLVGESGCGKSTISRSLVGLLPVREGQIIFDGKDLATLPQSEWRNVRRQIQMVFQDPFSSLNPRINIGDMLMEPLQVHGIVPHSELRKEAKRLLDLVQLPVDSLKRYPHQFSGGQRQRLVIARALAMRPQLLICDESVSALDVSVQAQILNLLRDLQQEFQLTYLFISHDLSVVHYISDRVMVMQAGKIVEAGEAGQVLKHPASEYTKKLVTAIPTMK